MKKSVFVTTIAIVALSGCSRSGFIETRIVSKVKQTCPSDSICKIRIEEITPFQWDRMYAFKYTASQQDVERAVGVKVKGFKELQRAMIFEKDGKVLVYESEPTNVEHTVKDELVFDIPENSTFRSYSAGTEFSVKRIDSTNPYYQLTALN